jgi:hypothetical protein
VTRRERRRPIFLVVKGDRNANQTATGDAKIGTVRAVRTVVVTKREDLEIARQVRGFLGRMAEWR